VLIDWFTVGAQALNFAVLVWLMKRFLYKPVLDAIAAREGRIAAELADADKKKAEAAKDRDDFQHRNDAFDHERAGLITKATDDANGERDRLLEAARKAADDLAAKRAQTLKADAESLGNNLRARTQQEVFAIARKALGDLASASLEESMCDAFARRLLALDAPEKARMGAALASASGPLLVRSAFELPAAQRATLQKAIDETFEMKAVLHFETSPDLIGGVELSASGQKLAWSISDYLMSLERAVGAMLEPTAVAELVTKVVAKTAPASAPVEVLTPAPKPVLEPAPS
jgi:F-type H+-transporting ATPase subunit b